MDPRRSATAGEIEVGGSGPTGALAQAAAIGRVVGGDAVQSVVLIFPIDVVSASGGFGFERRDRFGNPNQPVAVRIGQRPQHHGVHNAENRSIGADAQRQREHRDRCKARISAQLPQAITDVLQEILDIVYSAHIPALLFDLLDSAKLAQGRIPRVL